MTAPLQTKFLDLPGDLRESEPHTPESDLFVDKRFRICSKCPDGKDVHPLRKFYRKANGDYSVLCRQCLDHEHYKYVEQSDAQAVNAMSTALTESKKHDLSVAAILRQTLQAVGGNVSAGEMAGRVLHKAMQNGLTETANTGQITLAVKAATTILDCATTAEKNKKAGDFSEWTDEEAADICMELILANKTLRNRLINDKTIRALLLEEAGISVIEVKSSKRDEPE